MDERFFAREDQLVPGPPRDFIGYADRPPRVRWPNDARVAVQLIVNYEEGSEKSYPMGDGVNDWLSENTMLLEGHRDLTFESSYEYGSRAGIWRLFRIFEDAEVPATFFAAAVALERNAPVAAKIAERDDEVAGHGYRWIRHYEMTRDEEREVIRRAVESIAATVGRRPLGWYSRFMSVNTRELLKEEGGFVYDSEAYNDDIPYWTSVHGEPHLVVPYSLVVNDFRYLIPQGYSRPDDFLAYARGTVDRLRADGDDVSRMMSVGLHPRITGHPARADALARFIDYARGLDDVWFARSIDIANVFREQHPPEEFVAAQDGRKVVEQES